MLIEIEFKNNGEASDAETNQAEVGKQNASVFRFVEVTSPTAEAINCTRQ